MNLSLTAEQALVRETARAFVDAEVLPYAREWDRAESMDRAIVAKLAEVGFLGSRLPTDYGGMSLDAISYCLIMEELGRADSSVRGIVSVTVGLVGKPIARWGTEEQKREWLPKLASGEALGCYALTEPGSGSDPSSLATRAERDGDDWVLGGSKIFITLGSWAAVALVFARTGGEGARGITCFLVATDAPGFSAQPIKGKLGLRAGHRRALPRRRPGSRLEPARRADQGDAHTRESSVAKYYASEASVRAANAAVQVHGGYGYVDEYPVGKYLRDARVTTLYEGTARCRS